MERNANEASDEDEAIAITRKGVTTLFNGPKTVAVINRRGKCRPLWRRQPRWSRIHSVEYLEGKTLSRVHVISQTPQKITAYVRVISPQQLRAQCDDCMRSHRPTNKKCSATLSLKTNARNPNFLYFWDNKKSAGKWKRTQWTIGARDRVGEAVYEKL